MRSDCSACMLVLAASSTDNPAGHRFDLVHYPLCEFTHAHTPSEQPLESVSTLVAYPLCKSALNICLGHRFDLVHYLYVNSTAH
jgi:hypothetical protein